MNSVRFIVEGNYKRGGDINLGALIFYFLLVYGVIVLPRYIRYRGSTYKITKGWWDNNRDWFNHGFWNRNLCIWIKELQRLDFCD